MKLTNRQLKKARQKRIRASLHGTAARPRLSVHRSLNNISAQLIDDQAGVVLASSSSHADKKRAGVDLAKKVGADLAKKAKAQKIDTCVFDRSGYLYHGRVKALAEGAREGGLQF